jgi:hypothetical protein
VHHTLAYVYEDGKMFSSGPLGDNLEPHFCFLLWVYFLRVDLQKFGRSCTSVSLR